MKIQKRDLLDFSNPEEIEADFVEFETLTGWVRVSPSNDDRGVTISVGEGVNESVGDLTIVPECGNRISVFGSQAERVDIRKKAQSLRDTFVSKMGSPCRRGEPLSDEERKIYRSLKRRDEK